MLTSTVAKSQQDGIPLNELRAFSEAYYQIKSQYVRSVDDATLIRAAISGMVNSLDKHSRYLSADEFSRFNTANNGQYAGIGIRVINHKFGIEIVQVIKNSPAALAGIKPAMLITHINQKACQFMTAKDAHTLLTGEVGSTVELTIASADFAKPRQFNLERENILLESIKSEALPNHTAYIAISQFTQNSVDEFIDAIQQLSTKTPIEKLIIDLRNNPGGVMDIAIKLSDLFIDRGKLLTSNGRKENANEVFYATQSAPYADLEVIVVINKGSASASEILAAALQDHHKALILGENSYGKGSIQTVIPLNHESGIKLTSAEYFSPAGNRIQDHGIKPDVIFNSQNNSIQNPYNVSLLDDPQLLQAYNLLLTKTQD